MTKYFADTNIFVRYYLKDDEKLSPLAQKIIQNCLNGKYSLVICAVTLLETVWILGSFYKQPKDKLVNFLENILEIKNLTVADQDLTKTMFLTYRSTNVDITDSYFSALMDQEKIKEIFSFDRDFDKIPSIKRLEKL
ncbi:MAG: PIN domain-containing protein [Patescibacteria group bacterium]|nr:PIN domain-containing protein [Patescibacteria group bacterium]MCL5431950.1 PIN domain-containing protein [Patescibacteria group bacterium]